jgi:hypothetical protein
MPITLKRKPKEPIGESAHTEAVSGAPNASSSAENDQHGPVAPEAEVNAAASAEIGTQNSKWLTRAEAAKHLTEIGYPISVKRLAKLAVTKAGPPYRRWRNRALYEVEALEQWAKTGAKNCATDKAAE